MNTNNDPNLNDISCCDTNEILQIGFSDSDIQIGFELSSFDYPKSVGCDGNGVCNENNDEPSKLISCYQCDKLFDNEIMVGEDCLSKNEDEECQISKPKRNEGGENQRKFKIWKCKYNCGKIFTQEKYMNSHIIVMHENAKKISCKICFSHLSTESRLKNHMLHHSKIKHLICLICLKKRTKELSCIRHHLLNKHNISNKHPLFEEAYYRMSLKEIAAEDKCLKKEGMIKFKSRGISASCLQEKLTEKSKLICDKLKTLPKNELGRKGQTLDKTRYSLGGSMYFSRVQTSKKVKKIVIAENGMKLVKLPNGQFRKFK